MRILVTAIVLVVAMSARDHAAADPYRWCAEYGIGGDGGTNCYFTTLEQCQAAASGVGGVCRPNTFYDGRPAPASTVAPRSSKSSRH